MRPAVIAATADLTWLFERGIPSFERSPSGAMYERQLLFKVRHVADAETLRARLDREPWEPPVGALTAQPMHETVSATREEPDTSTLVRYGEVTRQLERVAGVDAQAARALALAFGHEGARWARHDRGRCVALFTLVPSGIALLERTKAFELCKACGHARRRHELAEVAREKVGSKALPPKLVEQCCGTRLGEDGKQVACKCGGFTPGLEITDADRIRVQVEVDSVSNGRDGGRRVLILAALREASALLAEAMELWVRTRAGA